MKEDEIKIKRINDLSKQVHKRTAKEKQSVNKSKHH